mmetsp:Transcript_13826/g.30030  ORF Transcript_13826/g.30030 Transcript_13826/m.30030 type:complete len:526 (+) Transcript_13826:423-2000(+)
MGTAVSHLRVIFQKFHVDLVRGSLPIGGPAENDDGVARLGDACDPALPHHLLIQGHRILERINDVGVATLQRAEALASDLFAGCEDGDRHARAELGHVARGGTGLRVHDNALGPHVDGGLHGRRRQRLRRRELVPPPHRVAYALVQHAEVDRALGLRARPRHDLHGLSEVRSVGRLPRKHDCVRAVVARVGDVGALRAGGTGVYNHGLQHLCGGDDRLPRDVRLADHVLLCEEDLLGRDLHAQIAASDHDAVRHAEDVLVVVKSFLVLDLGNDFDAAPAVFREDFADVRHVRGFTHERRRDEIDTVLDAPIDDVIDILLSQSGQIDHHPRKIHIFAFPECGVIFDARHDLTSGLIARNDCEHKTPVGDENRLACFHARRKLLVRASQLLVVSLETVVVREGESFAFGKGDRFGSVGEESGANFRTFRIQQHSDVLAHVFGCLPQPIQACLVPRMITVGKVEPRHVHARLDHLLELLHLPTCRTEGAENFGPASGGQVGGFDGVKGDVPASKEGDAGCIGDHVSAV